MAFDAYLWFKNGSSFNVMGESTSEISTKYFNGEAIEVTEYSLGVEMKATERRSDGGGATIGRADLQVFTCKKSIDTASCGLAQCCCRGTHIPIITLDVFRSGGDVKGGAQRYIWATFENCVITKVEIESGGDDELPTENLEFNYGKVTWHYQLTDHKSGAPISGKTKDFGWDSIGNKDRLDLTYSSPGKV